MFKESLAFYFHRSLKLQLYKKQVMTLEKVTFRNQDFEQVKSSVQNKGFLTIKAPPIICSRRQLQILSLKKKTNKACLQTILMLYHTLFLQKIGKDGAKFVSAAVVSGALRAKNTYLKFWGRRSF